MAGLDKAFAAYYEANSGRYDFGRAENLRRASFEASVAFLDSLEESLDRKIDRSELFGKRRRRKEQ